MRTPIEANPVAPASNSPKPPRANAEARLKGDILAALTRLDGGAGFKISRGRLRDDLIASGAIETGSRGHMTSSARHKFSRAMLALRGKHGALRELNGVVWRAGAIAERERAVAAAVADAISKERAAAGALAERCQADLERAVADAVAKEREAASKAIGERDRAIEAFKHAGALAKAQHAKAAADHQKALTLADERATAAVRKLANAAARERTAARAIADLARTFPHQAPAMAHDGEPTFLD